jgi:hypothetical protein
MEHKDDSASAAAAETAPICTSPYGMIVVLKRDGRDSASFELTDTEYTFGRASHCDIRIQVPTIGDTHCRMKRNAKGQVSNVMIFFVSYFLVVDGTAER